MPAEIRDSYGNRQTVDSLINTAGAQTVRLLGPFRVAHDTSGLLGETPLVLDATADPDAWVLSVWVVVLELFDNAFTDSLAIGRSDDDLVDLARDYVAVDSGAPDTDQGRIDTNHTPWKIGPGLAVVMAVDDPPAVTEGEADIYALIAEPA